MISFRVPMKLPASRAPFEAGCLFSTDGVSGEFGAPGVCAGDGAAAAIAVAGGLISSVAVEEVDAAGGVSETELVTCSLRFVLAAGAKRERRPRTQIRTTRPAITMITMSSTRKRARPVP